MNPRINFLTYNFGATKTALIGLQPPAYFDMSFIVFTNSVPQHKCVNMADIELPRRSNKSYNFNSDTCTQPGWPDGRIKRSSSSPKVAKKVDTIVCTLKVMLFKMSKQFSKYLGYFNYKICGQELPKITQSGHAAHNLIIPLLANWCENNKETLYFFFRHLMTWETLITSHCDQIGRFWKFLATKLLVKVVQKDCWLLGYFEKGQLILNLPLIFLGNFLPQHLVTLITINDWALHQWRGKVFNAAIFSGYIN